ncbi:MAG: hypothetical protein HZB13_12360 [Acidobacteria bacterium]|nr:hypothetical protein [Acidobacteriota bacterium]
MLAKPKKIVRAAKPAKPKRIRIESNPKPLSMDHHDGLITLDRLNDARVPMDRVFHKAGYRAER